MVMTKDVLFSLTKGAFAPQEEMLEVARKKGKLYIWNHCEIPKSLGIKLQEIQQNKANPLKWFSHFHALLCHSMLQTQMI